MTAERMPVHSGPTVQGDCADTEAKELHMKPFVMKLHEQDHGELRELREHELEAVTGGRLSNVGLQPQEPIRLNTVTVTPNGDGGDDGCDDDWAW